MVACRYPDDHEECGLQFTFSEFVTTTHDLYIQMQATDLTPEEEDHASMKFLQFILAGCTQVDNITRHITLNACQDLPYNSHLALNPVPPFKDTLFKPNHMKSLVYRDDNSQFVPMHKIPNFAFAKVTTCSVICMFFPCMYCMNDSLKIPATNMELIYNQCLRPLVSKHMSTMATHWPPLYLAALTLYHDTNSHIHPGSLDIPAHILDKFGHDYLTRLGQVRPYFCDTYFVHELWGWKAAAIHNSFNAQEREITLSELTHDLHIEKLNTDNWFIDTVLEIGVPKHVITWRTTGHKSILRHCLPSQDSKGVDNLVNKQSFNQDQMMHLLDLSGFHCETGIQGRRDKVKFIQAYMTEKTMAYQLHQGLFTEKKNAQDILMTKKLKKLAKDIDTMSVILYKCAANEDNQHKSQDGCARLKVRMPLSKALMTLSTCPHKFLKESTIAIPSEHWWYFKWYRLAGVYSIIKNLCYSSSKKRKSHNALALGGIVIWLLNSLYHRQQHDFEPLAREACQHVPINYKDYDSDVDHEEECFTPLMYDAGLYFICDIVDDHSGTYQIPYHKSFSEQALISAFKLSTDQMRQIVGVGDHPRRRPNGNLQRMSNQSTRTTIRVEDIQAEDRPLPKIASDLGNMSLQPPHGMDGDNSRLMEEEIEIIP
ncbi:hypothetical protein J3R83DRAFT_11787 [Lanmaoa asiatica]|nr:hypothetical protein J3R83DRAFT_11787 [Lanmaoa asiatica]